jgi:hypothetical protein
MFRVLFILPLLLCFCNRRPDLKKEEARYDAYINALPELKPAAAPRVTLHVHYVRADNLTGLASDERTQVYRDLIRLAKSVFGIHLDIREGRVSVLPDFFRKVRDRFEKFPVAYPSHAFPVSYFAVDRDERIGKSIAAALAKADPQKVKTYLGNGPDYAGEFIKKLTAIFSERSHQGIALLSEENMGDEVYFSYGHWSSILQGEKEADFFLTDAGIIGADTGMPLYVIARGGVTSAFVENNIHRPLQGAGVLGLYPFLADTPFFNEQRGKLSRSEKLECITWLWLHELGHLILKKDENYTFEDSVHRAPPNLRYYDWVKKVKQTANHRTKEIPDMKKF